MTSTQTRTVPIEIGFLKLSSENKAVLDFYLDSIGSELFKQVATESADVIIFDHDLIESKEHWEKLHKEANKPAIIISNKEVTLPNTVWVKKPLTANDLKNAASKIKAQFKSEDPQVIPNLPAELELELETVEASPSTTENKLELTTQDTPDLHTGSQTKNETPDAIDSLLDSLNSDIKAREEIVKEDTLQATNDELSPILDAKIAEEPESEVDTLINSLDVNTLEEIELVTEELQPSLEAETELTLTPNSDDEAAASPEIKVEPKIDIDEPINEIIEVEDLIARDEMETPASEETTKNASDEQDSDLQAMLDEIQQEMIGSSTVATHKIRSSNDTQETHFSHEDVNTPERWALLCGDVNSVKNAAGIKKNAFKLKNHLLSYLLDAVEKAKKSELGMQIKYDDILLLIDPELDTIYCDTSLYSEEYAHICHEPVEHSYVKVHSLDSSESRMLHKKLESEPENAHSIEAFLWTSALLTSRGRLQKNTNSSTMAKLKSWPALKTLEPIPHMQNIAVKLSKGDSSLIEVSKSIEVPQCYVFSFYNAALCLDKIISDDATVKKGKKSYFGIKMKAKSTESNKQKIFANLFNKTKS